MAKNEIAIVKDTDTLKALLSNPNALAAMNDVLPQHMNPERMVKLACIAASRNPGLLKCTKASIVKSVMDASACGIDFSGLGGRGYLVPYRNNQAGTTEAQFQIGYRGLMDLARHAGGISSIWGEVVYKDDEFFIDLGKHILSHVPNYDGDRSDKAIIGAYAKVVFRDGGDEFCYMPRAEIEKVRGSSKAKSDKSPWSTHYDRMCRNE